MTLLSPLPLSTTRSYSKRQASSAAQIHYSERVRPQQLFGMAPPRVSHTEKIKDKIRSLRERANIFRNTASYLSNVVAPEEIQRAVPYEIESKEAGKRAENSLYWMNLEPSPKTSINLYGGYELWATPRYLARKRSMESHLATERQSHRIASQHRKEAEKAKKEATQNLIDATIAECKANELYESLKPPISNTYGKNRPSSSHEFSLPRRSTAPVNSQKHVFEHEFGIRKSPTVPLTTPKSYERGSVEIPLPSRDLPSRQRRASFSIAQDSRPNLFRTPDTGRVDLGSYGTGFGVNPFPFVTTERRGRQENTESGNYETHPLPRAFRLQPEVIIVEDTSHLKRPRRAQSARPSSRKQDIPKGSQMAGIAHGEKGMNRVHEWRQHAEAGLPSNEETSTVGRLRSSSRHGRRR